MAPRSVLRSSRAARYVMLLLANLAVSALIISAMLSAREPSHVDAVSTSGGPTIASHTSRKLQQVVDPAPGAAVLPVDTKCPADQNGIPSNACFSANGLTHVCCIDPDSCGPNDASGGATCAHQQYLTFSKETFQLVGPMVVCPVCQGAPSNPCYSSYGDTKVCCQNPSSCDPATGPAMCTGGEYVTFTGTFESPVPIGC
ncbi:hypothetical protein KFL_000330360 [Klebsormidium nitens]|uniref:Uncharacterized protein n=1 Tax=Klebsormidium nitens TaxID=105231 RepID=A0A1Y1HQX8_KLENI|nr:hypothetical protein KFL_000330360 [Klebsormidium nitens]|eukprot:GAQ79589.1 hypothetical protein KFL_000330360 [Klebsormidium nitens]